ncbi:glutamyl aminopeptidase-like [Nylanderia fulva]|uniref:glutamyl aminopeptidase-like n=1 Tax=Nylanderia fulva TaxID=613905 RepID=UPI0010FAE7CA|nr:glutamyl aminopeptidase-like [Nylanderia fulva]
MITLKMSPKVDYVAIPDFPEEALETWGLVLYRETNVINKEPPLLGMTHNIMKIIRLIAHNIAHESVDNLLPWLNEGFSRFLELFIIDENFKFCRMMDLFVVQDQHDSFRLNSYFYKASYKITIV